MADTVPMFEFTSPYLDEPLRFNSVQELQDWVKHEIDAWQPIRDLNRRIDSAWVNYVYTAMITAISNIKNTEGMNEPKNIVIINQNITYIKDGKYIPSTSTEAMRCIDLAKSNPHAALMAIFNHISIQPEQNRSFPHWTAAYTAANAAVQAEMDTTELNRTKGKQLQAYEDYTAQMSYQKTGWNEFLSKTDAEMAELVQAHWNEMARIKNEYEEELRLRSASSYWKTKEEQHAFAARLWLGVFGGTAFTLLIALFGLAPIYLRSLPHNAAGDIGISGLAAVTLPALMILWVMRHLSRLFVTHFHQREDARQRRVLITTYLALHNKSAASDAERLLILQALFRPNATKDDDDFGAQSLIDSMAKALPK